MVTAFVPSAAPKLAVSRDGMHAVIVDGGRAAVRTLDREAACELPAGDVGWIGTARLLVVSTADAHTEVRLIDPIEGRRVAEIRLDSAMRLGAINGSHALLLGSRGAAIVAAAETTLMPYQFLARTLPHVVGVAGSQFVVALPGTIEEWDPASRMPKRRLRLPKIAAITSLGGSDRVLWMTTAQEPQRLDVLPLVNRGQPKSHELPEPIASVAGHPTTDAVICIGAETGRIYALDLDGRTRLRTIALPGIDRAEVAALVVRGAALSVIAAQTGRPIATAAIEGAREAEAPATLPPIKRAIEPVSKAAGSSLYDAGEPVRPRTVAEALRRPVAGAVELSPAQSIANTRRAHSNSEQIRIAAQETPAARTITEALRNRTPQRGPSIPDDPSDAVLDDEAPAEPVFARTRSPRREIRAAEIDPEVSFAELDEPAPANRRPDPPAARTITEALRRQSEPPPDATSTPRDYPLPGDDLEQALTVDTELVLPRQPTTTAWSEGASELMAKLASLRTTRDGAADAPLRSTWRDDAGAWARAVASGTFDRAAPNCPPIDTLVARFDLPATLAPALVLLYGSHLAGMQGAAPMDVAKVLGRRWDEALGRGKLAELGLATYADSRVRLVGAIRRALDELPPAGELVGEPGVVGLLGPTVLVSREPLRVLGVRIVEQLGGAVLLGSYVDAVELALEARALGALAVGQVDLAAIPHHPILVVVGDEAAAEQIDLPRFELAPPAEHQPT